MNKLKCIGTLIGITLSSYNAGGQVPSDYTPQSRETAQILYELGQKGQLEVNKTESRRETSFKFTPTTDIDSFFRRSNLSEVIYLDAGKEGPSDEDTLITRMSYIIREYDEKFDGKPASTDFRDEGLKGRITLVDWNMPPGSNIVDKMHYPEVAGEKITSDAEKYGVVMSYILEKIKSFEKKDKK